MNTETKFAKLSLNDELDQLLKQLAQNAQQQPFQSLQRQIALSQLVQTIVISDCLNHPQQELWSLSFYEDLYNEALQKTLLEICQHIDKHDPKYSIIAWANSCLKNQFIKVVNHYERSGCTDIPTIEDLDRYIPTKEA